MKKLIAIFFLIFPVLVIADPRIDRLEQIYDSDGDRIFENLQSRMALARNKERLPVIVLYKENTQLPGTLAARLSDAGEIKHIYHNIPAVALKMTVSQIREALKDPAVQQIELDSRVYATMNTARPSFGVDAVRTQFGFTGDGDGIKNNFSKDDVVIAVIDTGVNATHPDLQGKVLFWKDFVNLRSVPYDDNGHGTLVSGVALGAGKLKKKFMGVAPQAALVAIKVLNVEANGDVSDAIAAIDLLIDLKNDLNIRVLNLSLSTSGSSNGRDTFSQAANAAVAAGIVVVAAAGNNGPTAKTIGAPSAAAKVITVGAGSDTGERGFFLAGFSSRGPTADGRVKPDIWAPGVKIQAAGRTGGYASLTGTSFAAPFVAGVAALMLQANPALKPGGVKSILMKTAERWAPGIKNSEAGAGRLRAYEAVTKAAAITTGLNPPDVPKIFFVKSSIDSGHVQTFPFAVIDTRVAIAVTAILYNAPGPGIMMELIDPSGSVVSRQDHSSRQQTLTYRPPVSGTYTLRMTGFGGFTPYLLDISADSN